MGRVLARRAFTAVVLTRRSSWSRRPGHPVRSIARPVRARGPLAAVTLASGGDTQSSRLLWRQLLESEAEWLQQIADFRLRQLDVLPRREHRQQKEPLKDEPDLAQPEPAALRVGQRADAWLASLGARDIPRAEFVRHVRQLVTQPAVPSPWRFDADLVGTMEASPEPPAGASRQEL